MSESSTKRPPFTPPAATSRPAVAAAAVADATASALPAPRPLPTLARQGNPAAMLNPIAVFDAFAHGAEAYAGEMAGLLQTGFATATDATQAMLAARTLTEAFEINAGFVRKSLDTMLAGSIRLTDITARVTEESLRQMMPSR